MRAVVQRVSFAKVVVESEAVGEIERGLCVLVGVGRDDTDSDAAQLAAKVAGLRVFEDADHKMNLSVADVGGDVLAVSQFTLYGDARRGKRPSFTEAMEPVRAAELFELFCAKISEQRVTVKRGRFRAHMQVSLANEGPVTILLDSKRVF